FEIIDDSRDAPCPAGENSPVIAEIRRVETRGAEGPAAVVVTKRGVFGAIVVVEDHEGIAATEEVAVALGDLFSRCGRAGTSLTAGVWSWRCVSCGNNGHQRIDAFPLPWRMGERR